jgi:hypothetical protein
MINLTLSIHNSYGRAPTLYFSYDKQDNFFSPALRLESGEEDIEERRKTG